MRDNKIDSRLPMRQDVETCNLIPSSSVLHVLTVAVENSAFPFKEGTVFGPKLAGRNDGASHCGVLACSTKN
jgi:hypothetical protein